MDARSSYAPVNFLGVSGRCEHIGVADGDHCRDPDRRQQRAGVGPAEDGVLLTEEGRATDPLRHGADLAADGALHVPGMDQLRQHPRGHAREPAALERPYQSVEKRDVNDFIPAGDV